MTIQTAPYVVTNNLPAPTASSTIQSFTDVAGEAWVAKNSINSGNWMRARDALHAYIYRNATYNLVASPGAVFAFDTVNTDKWGMYSGASNYGLTAPIGGWYQALTEIQVTVSAANTFIQGWLQQNTPPSTVTQWTSENYFSARASGGLTWRSTALMWLAANDTVNVKVYNANAYPVGTGWLTAYLEMDYVGSG